MSLQKSKQNPLWTVYSIILCLIAAFFTFKILRSSSILFPHIEIVHDPLNQHLDILDHALSQNAKSPLLSIIPYRNQSTRRITWQKFQNGTGKIIIIHARKAGGTTMRSWFGRLRSSLLLHHRVQNFKFECCETGRVLYL